MWRGGEGRRNLGGFCVDGEWEWDVRTLTEEQEKGKNEKGA